MRRKKGEPFSGRPHSGLGWVLLLAALALFLLAGAPGCMAQGPADSVVCPGNDDLSALRSLKKGASCCTERSPFHFPSEYGSCPETVSTSASSSSER